MLHPPLTRTIGRWLWLLLALAPAINLPAQELGVDWTWRNPLPQGNSLHDVIWIGSRYVACGRAGTILTSPDGEAWASRPSGTGGYLRRLARDGSVIVAVGRDGAITTSFDGGETWTTRASGSTSNLTTILRAGSRWVALAQDGGTGRVVTSADGVTWTPASGMESFFTSGAAWSGTRLVAVGIAALPDFSFQPSIATSTDGSAWTTGSPSTTTDSVTAVVWTGAQFIIAGNAAGQLVVQTSPDGLTWTRRLQNIQGGFSTMVWTGVNAVCGGSTNLCTSPDGVVWTAHPTVPFVERLTENGGRVLALGDYGQVSQSDDHGQSWITRSAGVKDNLNAAAPSGDGWLVVGAEGTIVTSAAGTDWTPRSSGMTGTIRGLAQSDGQWLAVGRGVDDTGALVGRVLTSGDGVSWTMGPSALGARLYAAVRTADQWVVSGLGTVYTSPNGLSWTPHTAGAAGREVRGLAFNGSRLVAVGGDDREDSEIGCIAYSDDAGATWNSAQCTSAILQGATWTGSQFVVVGDYQQIRTSPTGAPGTWTIRTGAGSGHLRSVAHDATRIVVAGFDGIQTSTNDGVTWTYSTVPNEEYLYAVIKAGSQWVASGYDGTLLTSPDALNWTERETGTDHELFALTATPTGLWAGGEGGTILSSMAPSSDDADHDGLSSLFESYFGTDPAVPNGSPWSALRDETGFQLRWPEVNATGKTVIPQWSPNLPTWLADGESAAGIPARRLLLTTPQPGQRQATLDTAGLPAAFLRLKVTQP